MYKKNNYKSLRFHFNNQWTGYVCQLYGVGWELRTTSYSYGIKKFGQTLDRYLLQYTLSGEGHIRIGENHYDLTPEDAFLVKLPGDCHYHLPKNSDKWELLFLTIRGTEAVKDIWSNIVNTRGPIIKIKRNAPIIQTMFQIQQLAANQLIQDEFYAAGLAYQYLMELHRLQMPDYQFTRNQLPEWVNLIIEYLKSNFHRDVGLNDLIEITKMNKYHLIRSFQKATGRTPVQYLIRIRIQHSLKLLKQTDLSIHEIAISSGFSSPIYFSRVFRSWLGMTPSDFRASADVNVDEVYI